MEISVRLFAGLREHARSGTLVLELAVGATVGDAIASLRGGPLSGLPADAEFVVAVGRVYAARDRVLEPGDELALVPPVSGGAESRVRLASVTGEALDVDAIRRLVGDSKSGATVLFIGTTRDIPSLEYEAHVEMAGEQIALLAAAAVIAHDLTAVAVAHRTGTVALGEPSIVIAASAAHRREAFAGASDLLDAVKAQAPIWKREHPEDGPPAWVAGVLPSRLSGS